MAGINIPQKKGGGGMGNLMTLAGGAAGAFFGGPAGAAVGMQAGSALGGMAQQPESQGPAPVGGDAVSRRKAQLDQTPLRNIRDSIDSLQYIQDPAQRAELAKPLLQADYMARMKA